MTLWKGIKVGDTVRVSNTYTIYDGYVGTVMSQEEATGVFSVRLNTLVNAGKDNFLTIMYFFGKELEKIED